MHHALAGINIGTSKIVATLAMPDSEKVCVAEVQLAQQDPVAWIEALRESLVQVGAPPRGVLIAVCGTAGSLVFVDEFGTVLGPPMMYNDTIKNSEASFNARTRKDVQSFPEIAAAHSPLRRLFQALQNLTVEERARVRWVLPQSTWLSYMLALPRGTPWREIAADSTNCRKLEGRLSEPQWPAELFQRLGVSTEFLPRIVPAGTAIGPARGETARAWGIEDGTVFHGATDGTAEAMALVGDTLGAIGVMAGSTTSIKAVVPQGTEVSACAHLAEHPASEGNAFYTAWITVGENLRRRAVIEGTSLAALIESAWAVNENDIPVMALQKLPIASAWLHTRADLFARAVIESAAWWEAFHLAHIECICSGPDPGIHMIGGTTCASRWLQLRADAYQRPIQVYGAAGALGAILPGALKSGLIASPREFLDRYRVALQQVNPNALSVAVRRRQERARSWCE